MKTLKDAATWAQIARGAGLAATGAAATYILVYFGNLEWGAWAPTASAAIAVLTNIVRKFH